MSDTKVKIFSKHLSKYCFDIEKVSADGIGEIVPFGNTGKYTLDGDVLNTKTAEDLVELGYLKRIEDEANEEETVEVTSVEPISELEPAKPIEESKPEEPKAPAVKEPEPAPIEEKAKDEPVEAKPVEESKPVEPETPTVELEPAPEPKVEKTFDAWYPGFDFVLEKENEDAIPFRDSELCVVSDGMGGTGSKIVVIDDLDKFRAGAFSFMEGMYEKGDGTMEAFVDTIMEDLKKIEKDGKVEASNATFASRIICARFAYIKRHRFLNLSSLLVLEEKNEKEFINDIKDHLKKREYLPSLSEATEFTPEYFRLAMIFITFGLVKVRKDFNIGPYALSMLAVLPATLCATLTRNIGKKRVTDVFWAGDSRAYAFTKEKGLQLINEDDERGDGKMTNFICADRLAEIHHVRIDDLPTDSIIMACSDGAFDPFPLYDATAIAAIFSKLSKDFAEEELIDKAGWDKFAKALSDTYEHNFRMDDISFALSVYGHKGACLGKDFGLADDEAEARFAECQKYHSIMQTIDSLYNGNELADHYIEERAKSVVENRPGEICNLYFKEGGDIAMPEELVELLKSSRPADKIQWDVINDECYKALKDMESKDPQRLKAILKGPMAEQFERALDALEDAKALLGEPFPKVTVDNMEHMTVAIANLEYELSNRKNAVKKADQAKADFDAALNTAYRSESVLECMDEQLAQSIMSKIPTIEPSEEEVKAAMLAYIKANVNEVAALVAKGMIANLDKTSDLDPRFNATLLANSRKTLALLANRDNYLAFYKGIVKHEQEARYYLDKHFVRPEE